MSLLQCPRGGFCTRQDCNDLVCSHGSGDPYERRHGLEPAAQNQNPVPVSGRHGCHNRAPFAASYVAQNGWREARDGFGQPCPVPIHVDVPHVMSTDCKYVPPAGKTDPGCDGCRWRTT